MRDNNVQGCSLDVFPAQSDPFLAEWEQLEPFIQYAAWKAMDRLRSRVPAAVLDLEIDDLVQTIRIRLWQATQQRAIEHPKAYILRIAQNEVLQRLRSYRPVFPLPLGDDGELLLGDPLSSGTLAKDPAEQVEQVDSAERSLEQVIEAIDALPPRQRTAMLMSLKERADNLPALVQVCRMQRIDLERFNWPHHDKKASLRLKASVSIARKKLQRMLPIERERHDSPPVSYCHPADNRRYASG